jgi:peptidoglycan-associated lipoprotein
MAWAAPEPAQSVQRDNNPVNRLFSLHVAAAAAIFVFGSACAKKQVAVATPTAPTPEVAKPAPAPAPVVAAAPARPAPTTVAQATQPRIPDARTRARIDELLGRIQDAYFEYNQHNLTEDAVKTLNGDSKELATIMGQYPDYKLQVQGYCDERGSAEYNIALGEARAKAAKDYLVSVGVSGTQLSTVSFGKEKQVCDEQNESCWSKNRRIHIVALAMN